jgi:hypothetical protein
MASRRVYSRSSFSTLSRVSPVSGAAVGWGVTAGVGGAGVALGFGASVRVGSSWLCGAREHALNKSPTLSNIGTTILTRSVIATLPLRTDPTYTMITADAVRASLLFQA